MYALYMCDLNARTDNTSDVLEMGQGESELIDAYLSLENINVSESRVCFDNTVNNYSTRQLKLSGFVNHCRPNVYM